VPTSQYVQQLTVNVLADLGSHQQPKIATSGNLTWETRPWQQEKQHQMSQVSDEYRHRQSETASVKTAYAPDVLTLAFGNRALVNIIKSSDCIMWITGLKTTNDEVPGSCV
jgi:hypothetical protein